MNCPHCGKDTRLKLSNPTEYKRRKIENAKRSITKAKASGTKLGRPLIHDRAKMKALRRAGYSFRAIALELKCSTTAVQRGLK